MHPGSAEPVEKSRFVHYYLFIPLFENYTVPYLLILI
jgi:hypothetical protein